MTIASNITKIRRLVNDVNSQVFTDAQILAQVARAQQEFCRLTLCEVAVCALLAPPQIDYFFTHAWEEAYVPSGSTGYSPFYRDATYAATQPWELEASQVSSGGWTVTSGADLSAEEAQHAIPFILPTDFYSFKGLLWNKKWLEEKSKRWVQDNYRDAFIRLCDMIDYFSPAIAGRLKVFFTEGVPTTEGSATDQATAIDTALVANVFYAIYTQVPDRPTATTETLELHPPFHKYVEFRVADRLLRYDGPKKNQTKAEHMKNRWEMGVRFVRGLMWKLLSDRKLQLQGGRGTSLKPGRPRMPAHYPEIR